MARYVIHMKGEGPEALAGARFVRDGFSWLALSFGPLWLLAKGAWISACLATAVLVGFAAVTIGFGLPEVVTLLGLGLINLFLALESGALRSRELRLRGHTDVAIVSGDDLDVLEQRFFAEKVSEGPVSSVPSSPARASTPIPVIGLFPSPPRGGHP